VIETTQIGGRRLVRLMAGKLSPGNFGLLQHNRHIAAQSQCGGMSAAGESGRSIVIATVVRKGQRIAELEAEIEAVQAAGPGAGRGANRRRSGVGSARGGRSTNVRIRRTTYFILAA
jgi:hypothetical protein